MKEEKGEKKRDENSPKDGVECRSK